MKASAAVETFVTRKITLAAARIKQGLQEKLSLGNLSSLRDWGVCKRLCRMYVAHSTARKT